MDSPLPVTDDAMDDYDTYVFPKGSKLDVVLPDGTHLYWSTHCRCVDGDHAKCGATELAPGVPRKPAQCKSCGAPCQCRECGHEDAPPARQDGR